MASRRRSDPWLWKTSGTLLASYLTVLTGMAAVLLIAMVVHPEADQRMLVGFWGVTLLVLLGRLSQFVPRGLFEESNREVLRGWLASVMAPFRSREHTTAHPLRPWKRKRGAAVPRPHGDPDSTFVPDRYDEDAPWR